MWSSDKIIASHKIGFLHNLGLWVQLSTGEGNCLDPDGCFDDLVPPAPASVLALLSSSSPVLSDFEAFGKF